MGIDLLEDWRLKASKKARSGNLGIDFFLQDARDWNLSLDFGVAIILCKGVFNGG